MNAKIINDLYKRIQETPNGVGVVKTDLHIHTPASRDFVYRPLEKDAAYLNILDSALENNIRIIAITDHNTFSGYRYLKALMNIPSNREKYRDLLVLCGIEITCFSKHLLAIFPDSFDEKKQDKFLDEIGIHESLRGSEDALADNLGPSLLIERIHFYDGYAILAHADGNKGFLQGLCSKKSTDTDLDFSGKSLAKILRSNGLIAIQCNSDNSAAILKTKLKNKDFIRELNPLAYIKCSDCHGVCVDGKYTSPSGASIGTYYSEVKLSEISFSALKMALLDSEMRVIGTADDSAHMYIEGIAVQSPIFSKNNEYSYFHFGNELNCIIGSRGTGKTTLLEVIQSIIMPNSLKGQALISAFSKYALAVVFLKNHNTIYALTAQPKRTVDKYTNEISYDSNLKIYKKNNHASQFTPHKKGEKLEFLEMFLTAGYQQRQLYTYSKNPSKILEIVDDFINWKHHEEYKKITGQISYQMSSLAERLEKIRKERSTKGLSFYQYIEDHGYVQSIVSHISRINDQKLLLSQLREKMIDELNAVLVGKVQLSTFGRINYREWMSDIRFLGEQVSHIARKTYEYEFSIFKCLEKAYVCSTIERRFEFYQLLICGKFSDIRNRYKMPSSLTDQDLIYIRSLISEDEIQTFVDDGLSLKYNINAGTEYAEQFKNNNQISMGQNAVALLLLILNASHSLSDNRPLLMDQPEDDLDNSYIYSTLVKEFRNSKQKRQIIISTHNPNIPVAADAESILVLRFNGTHGYLANCGAIDSKITANAVLEIMEGGHEALNRRITKYNTQNFGNH